jgi:hypothetical protein
MRLKTAKSSNPQLTSSFISMPSAGKASIMDAQIHKLGWNRKADRGALVRELSVVMAASLRQACLAIGA